MLLRREFLRHSSLCHQPLLGYMHLLNLWAEVRRLVQVPLSFCVVQCCPGTVSIFCGCQAHSESSPVFFLVRSRVRAAGSREVISFVPGLRIFSSFPAS